MNSLIERAAQQFTDGVLYSDDKGALAVIPLHSIYSAKNPQLKKGKKMSWELSMEILK